MKWFEAVIKQPDGMKFTDRVKATDAYEARWLLQQRHGYHAVPVLPKIAANQ